MILASTGLYPRIFIQTAFIDAIQYINVEEFRGDLTYQYTGVTTAAMAIADFNNGIQKYAFVKLLSTFNRYVSGHIFGETNGIRECA